MADGRESAGKPRDGQSKIANLSGEITAKAYEAKDVA